MNRSMAIEWLKSAKIDLDTIACIISDEHLTPSVAFHSQQACEKSLKAILEYYKLEVPKIHSLNKLSKLIEKYITIDNTEIIDILDTLYIETRYPGLLGLLPDGKPTVDDAKEFYAFARYIFETTCDYLNISINDLLK